MIEIHETRPETFAAKIEVAAIYVCVVEKILLLKVAEGKSEAGFWGVPAGKVDAGETAVAAAKRELFEETGIDIDSESHFISHGTLYMSKPHVQYAYHMFGINLDGMPAIVLSAREHSHYQWVAKDELEGIQLMQGALEALEYYFKMI